MDTPLLQRLATADLGEHWHKTLSVPPAHRALLYTGNDYRGSVGPGTHTLDTRLARLNRLGEDKRPGAVLLRDGPWLLDLELQTLAEDTPVAAAVNLSLDIADPPLLVTELLGARDRLDVDDLRQRMAPPLTRCLTPPSDDPRRLAARIAADLGTWLGDWGLRLAAVPGVSLQADPDHPARVAHARQLTALQREQALALAEIQHRLGRHRLETAFQRDERVAEARTDAEIGDIQRGQARADLDLEAEREKLWRERMAFLVELDNRWR